MRCLAYSRCFGMDIPGVPYGTPLHRLDNTVRCLPYSRCFGMDIPGVPYGTPLHRLDNTVRRLLYSRCFGMEFPGVPYGKPLHRLDNTVRHLQCLPAVMWHRCLSAHIVRRVHPSIAMDCRTTPSLPAQLPVHRLARFFQTSCRRLGVFFRSSLVGTA